MILVTNPTAWRAVADLYHGFFTGMILRAVVQRDAKDAAAALEAAGLRVAYVDGETPDEERRGIFRQLNYHQIDYLCNVQVVERGTDIPGIQCVQLCVAIGSIVRYRQMVGRGSRVHP
jgi:superfamily II DNA or RNA helicase